MLKGPLISQVTHGWYNNHYSVLRRPVSIPGVGVVDHLWIGRTDRSSVRSWDDIQQIKCDLVEDGAHRRAVEEYPRAGEVLNQSPWTHIWVYPRGYEFPHSMHKERFSE